jgi:uncharacterized radical SAM superfamily Fe-S cluster-containing enzyme
MNIKSKLYWLTLRFNNKFGSILTKGVRATVVTTTRCPLDCDYCPMYIYGDVKRYDECTFEEWKTWFERFPTWISQVYVSGGEPSLYKDIVPLVNWLVERGHHVIVFTNLWKVENYEGIKNHWRLRFMPTYHKFDKIDRYKKSLAIMEKKFNISSQQLFENEHKFSRIKEFFTVDWFKDEDDGFQFAPDCPRTLQIYSGCVNLYRSDK